MAGSTVAKATVIEGQRYQMLFGNCGSWRFQLALDASRAALRRASLTWSAVTSPCSTKAGA